MRVLYLFLRSLQDVIKFYQLIPLGNYSVSIIRRVFVYFCYCFLASLGSFCYSTISKHFYKCNPGHTLSVPKSVRTGSSRGRRRMTFFVKNTFKHIFNLYLYIVIMQNNFHSNCRCECYLSQDIISYQNMRIASADGTRELRCWQIK